jgi:hypothetical protein
MNSVLNLIPVRKHEAVVESIGLLADAMKKANESARGGRTQ